MNLLKLLKGKKVNSNIYLKLQRFGQVLRKSERKCQIKIETKLFF